MSHIQSSATSHLPKRHVVRPWWFISIVAHVGLLAALATLPLGNARPTPHQPCTVGILVQKDWPQGVAPDSEESPFTEREDLAVRAIRLLSDAELPLACRLLPEVPEIDVPATGLSGSINIAASDTQVTSEAGVAAGALVITQFFGARAWGDSFVYVIDHSGSMAERDRLNIAKRELVASLAKLPPEAQFQIIFYNQQPGAVLEPQQPQLQSTTDENMLQVQRELECTVPEGGTAHLPALQMALSLRPDVIFLLTDADDLRAGDVDEATELNGHHAKIHTIEFGVGAEVDRMNQLEELAHRNGGTYRYIDAARFDLSAGEVTSQIGDK